MRFLVAACVVLAVLGPAGVAGGEPRRRCSEDTCWGPSSVEDARAQIAAAEALLKNGNAKRAARALGFIFTDDERTDAEIELIAAVAAMRAGLRDIRGQNPAKTIRLAHEANPNDPRVQALYAESLLRGSFRGSLATRTEAAKRHREALRLLTGLEAQKRITTAHGWAALARAHHRAGAAAAANAADAQCRVTVTAAKQAVCDWALETR